MSEKLPTNMLGLNSYVESLMEKHKVLPVPTKEEVKVLIDEYHEIRNLTLNDRESMSKSEADTHLSRLRHIEKQLITYREYHHGKRH